MKKILLIVFAAMLSLVSCSSDNNDNKGEIDGLEDPMEISSKEVSLDTSKKEGIFINIPKSGETFSLQVNNYDDWWISSVSEKTDQSGDFKLNKQSRKSNRKVSKDGWYQVEVNSNKVECVISENDQAAPRTIQIVMTGGDVFQTFYIVQAAE